VGDDEELRKLGYRLCEVDGVVGVLLGGSRGSQEAVLRFDLGLYYRPRSTSRCTEIWRTMLWSDVRPPFEEVSDR